MLFVVLAGWLLASLFLVNIEFDDGYTTIVNSKYFLGHAPDYFWQRGPLIATLLIPAELLATWLHLHPLDVWPYHALMIAIHFMYLLGTWWVLSAHFGRTGPVLLAFAAAVPTFVFFSYAPFISHDIFPGLLALLMLVIANDYMHTPGRRQWLLLVSLGTLAALVKQTYASIWVATLIANLVVLPWDERDHRRRLFRAWMGLAGGAALSGIVTWLLYAWSLQGSFVDAPLWLRPYLQITQFVEYFRGGGPLREIIYQWVYLRNLSAYGIAAMVFVAPALILALRSGQRLQRTVAIAWLVLFVLMQIIAFKEVRYLAYLAPLTAFLLAPALIALVRQRSLLVYLFAALLLVDLQRIYGEAARITDPYYKNVVKDFLQPLPGKEDLHAPIIMTERLSFVSPERYAFFGDRYHRITNLIDDQIRMLYGYEQGAVVRFMDNRSLHGDMFVPGSFLIFVNDVAARVPPFPADNSTSLHENFTQLLAVAEPVTLRRQGEEYLLAAPSAQPMLLLPTPGRPSEPLVSFYAFTAESVQRAFAAPDAELQLTGFRILRMCTLKACSRY